MTLSVPQAQAAIIELLAARKPVPADLVAVVLGDPLKGVSLPPVRPTPKDDTNA